MTFSPYQHQDPRQISLQRQIEQSRQEGDIRRLQRLELQWVHRYGVASLPGADQTMIQSEVPQDNSELPPIEVSQDEVDRILGLGQTGAELKEQEPLELKEQEPLELKEQAHSVPASVVPVPIASPHRLRRWLKPLPLPESHKAS
ncbi:hypothetical protein ACLM45_13225 [Synechococcus sp. A10-1-5-9]|uniref:hypothetical protein n=1 Tax=Synechococcus sp. A10-1-5-9 TaxID=3392295 RepID=UPI0039ECEDD6